MIINHLWRGVKEKEVSMKGHWRWVCLAVFKHFYETGEFHHIDRGRLDAQNEYVCYRILKAHGADRKTIDGVICMKRIFEFESQG